MLLKPDDRILFTGDSITDGHRRLQGQGTCPIGVHYVLYTAVRLMAEFASPKLEIFNRGIGGNRMPDLLARFDEDCLALKPTVISVLIGINDTAQQMSGNPPPDTYEADFRTMLSRIRKELKARVVLMEPFLVPLQEEQRKWRADLDRRIDVVRRLAAEFGTDLIPLDGLFAEATTRAPADYWSFDGIHPSLQGHGLITQAWLKNAGIA